MDQKIDHKAEYAIRAVLHVVKNSGPVFLQNTAEHLGIPKRTLVFYLSRSLKISLTEFKQKHKILVAARLIESLPKTVHISEIAKTVGIPYQTTFARYFKKEFGITPRQYQIDHGDSKKLFNNINVSDMILRQMIRKYIRL